MIHLFCRYFLWLVLAGVCFYILVFVLLYPDLENRVHCFLSLSSCCSKADILQDNEVEYDDIENCMLHFQTYQNYSFDCLIPSMNRARIQGLNFLNSSSTVLEIGGYKGDDANILKDLYNPWYYIAEPVPEYFSKLVNRFGDDKKFKLYPFGLGRETKSLSLSANGDGSSGFQTIGKVENGTTILIRNITEFLESLGLPKRKFDYLQINCEGCEYEVLEVLLESGMVKGFRNLVFQFHLDLPGILDQELRFCNIIHLLHLTHRPRWRYHYVWQSWTIKTSD